MYASLCKYTKPFTAVITNPNIIGSKVFIFLNRTGGRVFAFLNDIDIGILLYYFTMFFSEFTAAIPTHNSHKTYQERFQTISFECPAKVRVSFRRALSGARILPARRPSRRLCPRARRIPRSRQPSLRERVLYECLSSCRL